MKIIVPATSANIGPGFDSVGVAVSKYLIIEVLGKSDQWIIEHDLGRRIPSNERNLLIKVARRIAPAIRPHHLKMTTNIPLARGLGSSSSVIVAGIELANQLVNLQLSNTEKLNLATKIEGHPDNVAPAIFGNLCCATGLKTKVLNTVISVPSELHFAVVVPEVMVSTEYARSVLPNHVPFKEAVQNVSHASLFVTSLITHQLNNLSVALDDNLHVPYRKTLIPHCEAAFEAAKAAGAYGATISGSGSTLIAYVDKAHVQAVADAMGAVFTSNGIENRTYCLEADSKGASII